MTIQVGFLPEGLTSDDLAKAPIGLNRDSRTLELSPSDPISGPASSIIAKLEEIRQKLNAGVFTFLQTSTVTADATPRTVSYEILPDFIHIMNEGNREVSVIYTMPASVSGGPATCLSPFGEIEKALRAQSITVSSASGTSLVTIEAMTL